MALRGRGETKDAGNFARDKEKTGSIVTVVSAERVGLLRENTDCVA